MVMLLVSAGGGITVLHLGHDQGSVLNASLIERELTILAQFVTLFPEDVENVGLVVNAENDRLGSLQLQLHPVEKTHHKLIQGGSVLVSPALLLPVPQFGIRQCGRSP